MNLVTPNHWPHSYRLLTTLDIMNGRQILKIRDKLTEDENMTVEMLIQKLVEWDLTVYRPCLTFMKKADDSSRNGQPADTSRLVQG